MIVIDSSAFSKFLLREEGWEEVVPYLDPMSEPYSVDILVIEAVNVVWKYMRRYRLITREQALGIYEQVMKLVEGRVITLEPSKKYLREALEIALDYDLPIYDSLFLAQAMSLKAKLITSDKRQGEIGGKMGIETVYID
ncbi:MAG TPA: PIN domain-containing protein [Thermoprotei archaeon]|nr:PIN domain-containing protein [Thermoprotei archaeon]